MKKGVPKSKKEFPIDDEFIDSDPDHILEHKGILPGKGNESAMEESDQYYGDEEETDQEDDFPMDDNDGE